METSGSSEPLFVRRRLDRHVVVLAFVYLMMAWLALIVVDVLNVAGIQDALPDGLQWRAIWFNLFSQAGPVEMMQFAMLGGTVVVGAVMAGTLHASRRPTPGSFWMLIAIGALILLVEEASDVRFKIWDMVSLVVGEGEAQRNIVELASFALLAAVPVYAVLRYWRVPWRSSSTRRYLVACFAVYVPTALASGTRNIGGDESWYVAWGQFLHERVFAGRLLEDFPAFLGKPPGYLLMDGPITESFELIGATMLLAAALAYAHHYRREPAIADLADR